MLDLYEAKEYFDKYGFIYGDRTDGQTHEITKLNEREEVENYLYMQRYDKKERHLINQETAIVLGYCLIKE